MKIAVFVEGYTELEFVQALIKAVCGSRGVTFEIQEQFKGKLVQVSINITPGAITHVLLVNCRNDDQVKTKLRDSYPSLVLAGYTCVMGLRDIYPDGTLVDVPKFQAALQTGLPTGPIPAEMYLAILEVESWFLDEITHFERVDPILTVQAVAAAGFDVVNTLGENWQHPAETLDQIYKTVGKGYKKKIHQIKRTVNALCPAELYVTARGRSNSLDRFLSGLEAALF